MAIIADVLNCGQGQVGTWFDGCKVTPKDYTKLFLKSPNLKIDLTSGTFLEADKALWIKQGLLVPLNDIQQVADAPAKNNYQTLPNKRQIYISQGLYMFNVMFEANTCLVKSLHKLSQRKWELLCLDSEDKLFFDNKGGLLNGFEIQDFSIDNETINDGGAKAAMVEAQIQLTQSGTAGYNKRKSFIVDDELSSLYGVQETRLASLTLTAASFKVTVLGGCDGTTPVLGLTTPNFRLINAATLANIPVTIVENGGGQYTVSGGTVGARVLQLFDITNNVPVADILLQRFYSSNALALTLV